MRSTGIEPGPDILEPRKEPTAFGFRFGSAHPGVMNGVFADGHVNQINYDVDVVVFNAMGHRSDGLVVDE